MSHIQDLKETLSSIQKSISDLKDHHEKRILSLENATVQQKSTSSRTGSSHVIERPLTDPSQKALSQKSLHTSLFLQYLRNGQSQDLQNLTQKSMDHTADAQGGVLMPSCLTERIFSPLKNISIFRQLADVMVSRGTAYDMIIDKSSNHDLQWGEEFTPDLLAQGSPTPLLEKVKIPLHPLTYRPRVTQALLDGATIDLEAWLIENTLRKVACAENRAFLHGDGDKQPLGIVSHIKEKMVPTYTLKTSLEEEEAPNSVLLDIVHQLAPQFLADACWVMSRQALRWVRGLTDKENRPLYWISTEKERQPSLMGYPVYICDDLDASCPMIFGNFKEGYQVISNDTLNVLRDPYTYKPYVELYMTYRVGGHIRFKEAIVGVVTPNHLHS